MKPIRIDFAPRTIQRALITTRPLTWLCVGLALALCISVLMSGLKLIDQKNALDARLQQAQATLAARMAPRPAPAPFKLAESHANAINGAILQLNFPWSAALDAIEKATPATIALLAIEPDSKKNLIKGLAEAHSAEGMIAYVEHLKEQPFFADVLLTKHEVNEQDPNRPFRFQFEAVIAESSE